MERVLALRTSLELWNRYGEVVGGMRRSPDLREYVQWRLRHPDYRLGSEPGSERGPIQRFYADPELIRRYERLIPEGGRSADLRAYVQWRVDHPDEQLPEPALARH